LDEQSGLLKNGGQNRKGQGGRSVFGNAEVWNPTHFAGDSGGASRFFFTAKASQHERNAGVTTPRKTTDDGRQTPIDNPYLRGETERRNGHPTVKPFKLMRYLINLITPPGGVVIDPFLGSGTTGAVAVACGYNFLGIEREAEYLEIAKGRIGDVRLDPTPALPTAE
jgi:site-specific DNA-methyltransferase (adenine-specific)